MSKPKVAFICVHNSCLSQIAEALGKHLAADVFESYSAGTETKPQINQDAVRLMKQIYSIDMEQPNTASCFPTFHRWMWSSPWAAMFNALCFLAPIVKTGGLMIPLVRMTEHSRRLSNVLKKGST